MTVSLVRSIDGVKFEVMSDSWNFKEPCILIPVSAAESLDSETIGESVKQLVSAAWFARALRTADWLMMHSKDNKKPPRKIPADILESYSEDINQMREFAGEDASIDQALALVEESLEAIAASRMAKERIRTRAQKIRSEMQADYSKTFVKIGRRDGFRCAICYSSESDLQIDHVIPVSKGGTNDPDNLQLLCKSCNAEKSDKEGPHHVRETPDR